MSASAKGVQVLIRFRPLNDTEKAKGPDNCVDLTSTTGIAVVGDSFAPPTTKAQGALDVALDQQKQFTFDHVFDPQAGQTDVYDTVGRPVVTNVLKGYNGTILAYGQTGSGKTHSMLGPEGGTVDVMSQTGPYYNKRGIIPRLIEDLFTRLQAVPEQEMSWKVGVSVFELYKEQIQDLLAHEGAAVQEYKIREDMVGGRGVYVENLYAKPCLSAPELLEAVKLGVSRRKVASTKSNDNSSRSHSLTMIMVEQTNHVQGGTVTRSRLNLIDLAGSEKISKTQADGERLKEAQQINLSLTFLGNVINKLTDGKGGFVPYRDSKLTRILQDSLGGNSLTTLFCHCSIASYNREETLGTLRFAARAKRIKNAPKVNRELSQKEMQLQLAQALDRIKFLEERAALQNGLSPIRNSRANRGASGDRHEDPHTEGGDIGSPNQQLAAAMEEREDLRATVESLLQQLDEVKRDLFVREEDLAERTQQVEFYKQKAAAAEAELSEVVSRAKRDEALVQRRLIDAQSEVLQLQQQLELQKASLVGSTSATNRIEDKLSNFDQDIGRTQHRTPINRPMNLRRPGAPRSNSTGPVELSISGKGQLTAAETMEGTPSGRTSSGIGASPVTELPAASELPNGDVPAQRKTSAGDGKRQRGPAGSTLQQQSSSNGGGSAPVAIGAVQAMEELVDSRQSRGPTPPSTPINGELAPRGQRSTSSNDAPKPEMIDCGVMAVVGKTDQELQKEIDDMQSHMKQLMGKSSIINKQLTESKEQLSKLNEMLEATRSERDDVSQELDALRKLLESKEKENELMRRIMEDLNINLSDFQHLLTDEKTRARNLADEADGLRGHNAALKQTADQQEFVEMATMELLIKAEDMEAVEQDLMRMPSLPTEELFLRKREFCLTTIRQLLHFLDNISSQLSKQKFNTGNLESRRLQLLAEAAGLTSRCDDASGLLTFSDKDKSPKGSPSRD